MGRLSQSVSHLRLTLRLAGLACAFVVGLSCQAWSALPDNFVSENIPEIPEQVSALVTKYAEARSATFLSWNGSGEAILLTTRLENVSQLHRVEVATGKRTQITFAKEPVTYGAFRPGTDDVVYSKDVGGSEDYHLFYYENATGETRQLSPDGGRNSSFLFSHDGKRLAFSRSEPGGTDRNIWMVEAPDFDQPKMILKVEGAWRITDWSPDGTKIILHHYISNTINYLHVLDIESGELTQINPSEENFAYRNAAFTKDGQNVFYLSDEGDEFLNLYRYNLRSGKKHNLTSRLNWDVTSFVLSSDGEKLAYSYNDNGSIWLRLISTATDRVEAKPVATSGVVQSFDFSPDGSRLAYTFTSPRKPGNVLVYDIATKEAKEWTFFEPKDLDPSEFVQPDLISYPTFDREGFRKRQIPAYVYRPEGEGPHPVVIYIHGGPASQFQPTFITSFQLWLKELGVAVIAPNVRGSAGYGKAYREMDNGYLREDSVKDIGALIEWIQADPGFDADRILVYGGSYGGYMVLASMVHFNDQLAGGIDSVGISNFVTFLENTRPYRRDLRRVEYGDERDPEMRAFLERISPANHADKISKPLFIIQGLNDPRVPHTEALQIMENIKSRGGEPWFLMANDEGHGFRKQINRDIRSATMILFMQQAFGLDPIEGVAE